MKQQSQPTSSQKQPIQPKAQAKTKEGSQPQAQPQSRAQAHQEAQPQAQSSATQTGPAGQTQGQNQGQASQPETSQQATNPYPNFQLEESQIAPGMYRPIPEEEILEWTAPSRPFKQHNKKYFSTVAVIALLISLILGFAGQLVAVTVVISLAFVVYVLSVVPPQNSTYKITTYGIRIDSGLYYWEELGYFWFDKKYDQDLLNIEVARFPGRLTLLLGNQDKKLLTDILSEVLINKRPEPTLYEKSSTWLQKKIPLDLDD